MQKIQTRAHAAWEGLCETQPWTAVDLLLLLLLLSLNFACRKRFVMVVVDQAMISQMLTVRVIQQLQASQQQQLGGGRVACNAVRMHACLHTLSSSMQCVGALIA